MLSRLTQQLLESSPALEGLGEAVARPLHRAILAGGTPTRTVADWLHGTWLGHPLHPVLTDIPIGAWMMGALFDGIAMLDDAPEAEYAADTLTTIGVISAVPTAMAGMADYSTIPGGSTAAATLHGLLNSAGLALYLWSLRERRNGNRSTGVILSSIALMILMLSAYIGGHMTFHQRVGVNHQEDPSGPRAWTPVLDAAELSESQARRVEVEGTPVMLYRYGGTVYAIGAVCRHAGGPLEEGSFDGFCVQCPWHDSVFDVRDGGLVHGPSTYPQPKYAARLQNGKIEVRLG